MNKSILRYCSSNEIETLTGAILAELEKEDWSADIMMSSIIGILKTEKENLTLGIEHTRGNVLKENLRDEDQTADVDFVCLKQFVKANTYLPDADLAKDADDIWELISAHDLQLYKMAYEKQISLSKSLLSNLANEKFKPKVDRLIGVADRVSKFAESTAALETAYSKVNEFDDDIVEVTVPSTQKNIVRNIINERLIPYLNTASKTLPEKYDAIFKDVCSSIKTLNTKARARKTRNQNEMEEKLID